MATDRAICPGRLRPQRIRPPTFTQTRKRRCTRQIHIRVIGSDVHIASKAGVVGEPGHAAYSAAKGVAIALTRAMAVELAPYHIRVNAVCPGPVLTDMLLAAVPTQAGRAELASLAPLKRIGQPADIAGAVLYLASAESDWCTGQVLSLDGGMSILLQPRLLRAEHESSGLSRHQRHPYRGHGAPSARSP
jgi:NAD(P)-dependent dehydrogenase (short-subunit alcohol dehydrogenase family)